ncbi:hypothetical protein [Streptomyces mirabilis]|uniref:hypothetical protein n=1 Tax=Streptomyces mirabilis TaxID=68239 RepID=UPI0033F1EAAC
MNTTTTRVSSVPRETVFDRYVRAVHAEISTAGETSSRQEDVDRKSMLWCAFYCVARDGNLVLAMDWTQAVDFAVLEADLELQAGSGAQELRELHRLTLNMAAEMNLDLPVDYTNITCPHCLGTRANLAADGEARRVCEHPNSLAAASLGITLLRRQEIGPRAEGVHYCNSTGLYEVLAVYPDPAVAERLLGPGISWAMKVWHAGTGHEFVHHMAWTVSDRLVSTWNAELAGTSGGER